MRNQRGTVETQIKYFRQILRRLVLNIELDSSPVEQLKLLLVCTANAMNSQKNLGSQLSKTQLFFGPLYYANSLNKDVMNLSDQTIDLQGIFNKRMNNVKTSKGSNIIYAVNEIILERDNYKTVESPNQLLQVLKITSPKCNEACLALKDKQCSICVLKPTTDMLVRNLGSNRIRTINAHHVKKISLQNMFLPFLDFSKLFGNLPRVRQKVDDQEIKGAQRYNLRSAVLSDVNYIVILDKKTT